MSSALYNYKTNTNSAHLFPTTISSAVKMIKFQNIAPAPATADQKTRKYSPRVSGHFGVDQTQSVQRRNARERNRVKQVNNSFARLRQHIPQTIIADLTKGGGRGPHKKISKVDTLRIAVEYIRRLQDLVDDLNGNTNSSSVNNNSDPISNSSFSSVSVTTSSPPPPPPSTTPQQQLGQQMTFYSNATSPLPSIQLTQHQSQQQQFPTGLLTPVSLQAYSPPQTQTEIGCHSPTSSFNSSMSFDSGTFEGTQQLSPLHLSINNTNNNNKNNNNSHLDAHLQLKFEPYDSFNLHEEECTPDDEEILDYISLWQEQ